MSGDKRRWPYQEALAVASALVEELESRCERIAIAGSLRRRKPTVGDVELVFVPKEVQRPAPGELFGEYTVPVDLVEERLQELLAAGVLEKRLSVKGRPSWGAQNRLAVHVASGMPVDLFATTSRCWHNYLVCRTGSAESNLRIAIAAQRMGWKWHPYADGFETRTGQWRRVTCEEDVFRLVGLPYLEPHEREAGNWKMTTAS